MGKFEQIYEEAIKEYKDFIVKQGKDIEDSVFQEIADKIDLESDLIPKFIKFMKERFKTENLSPAYIKEWAERFKNKTTYTYGDNTSHKILKKLGVKE